MALEATHIRLAISLKDELKIKDLEAYISGSIYPDSRYITKIDRIKTHNPEFINKDILKLDDFEKGWVLHLMVDKSYAKALKKIFNIIAGDEKKWTYNTAIKIIMDMDDFSKIKIKHFLEYTKYIRAENGESREKLIENFKILERLYKNKASLEKYEKFLSESGINCKKIKKIIKEIKCLIDDKEKMEKIKKLHKEMIKNLKIDYISKIINNK